MSFDFERMCETLKTRLCDKCVYKLETCDSVPFDMLCERCRTKLVQVVIEEAEASKT